jgi:hypothetical protein
MKRSILLVAIVSSLCFLSKTSGAQAPNWLWASSAGGTGQDYANSVAADASGNTLVAGTFGSPAITFGSTTLTNAGTNDMFLVKYDAGGNVLWAKSAGGADDDEALSIATDASGNTYMAGYFESAAITFGSYTLTNTLAGPGLGDISITKYDAYGNVKWAKSAGGTDADCAYSIIVDASGNIYVTGLFYSPTITFDSYTLTNAGICDMFLAKYDANGNVLWAKSAGGTDRDGALCVAVDASGDPYVAGRFSSSTITFGSYTLTNVSAGTPDIFLTKYDANGNVLWATTAGGVSADFASSIALDASGNIYMTGYFYSPVITFGSTTLTNAGIYDIFLVKYHANGNVIWATGAGSTGDDEAFSVAVDASGNPYITGHFESPSITFGSYTLMNAGIEDIFLTKYDANNNGNVFWAISAGGANADFASYIAMDPSGHIYMAGGFSSSAIAFGSTTLTNEGAAGTFDMFLAKSEGSYTGINGLTNSMNISVFPNPATDKITVEISGTTQGGSLTIADIEGQQLITRQITQPKTTIDISNLPGGVYFVRLTSQGMVKVGKIIKQ